MWGFEPAERTGLSESSDLAETGAVVSGVAALPVKESPLRRTFAAGALSIFNLGIKIGSNVVIIPLALHFLGRRDYGLWIVLQSVGTYLALSELGIGQTILNFQSVAYEKRDHQTVNRVLTTVFGLYWLIIVPVWLCAAYIFLAKPVDSWFLRDASGSASLLFKSYLALAGTLALLRVPLNIFPATLLGLRELTLRQLFEIVLAIALLLATCLTLVAGGKVLALILVTNAVLVALPILTYWLAKSRHPYLHLAWCFWTPSLIWPLLSNSLFFFLYGLGLLFQRLVGSILAGKLAGLDSVPAFFVLFTLFRVGGWSLADTFSQSMQPYIIMLNVQGRKGHMKFLAQVSTKFTFACAVIYCTLIWLLADQGLRLWVGPDMFLGYGPLALLGGSFLIDVFFLSTNNFMRGLNRHRALSVIMAVYAAMSFALGIVGSRFMPTNPTLGLCWGLFVASVLGQGLPLPWISYRWLQIGWKRYLSHFIIRPASLFVCCGVVSAGLFIGGMAHNWSRTASTSVVLLLLPVAAWFVVFDRSEREWFASVFARLKLSEGIGLAFILGDE